MYVTAIRVVGFRSYEDASIDLSPGLNVVVGSNASGKTNLVEAAYWALRGTSPRTRRDEKLVRWGAPYTRVELMLGELPELSALPGPLAHALEVAVDETVHNAIRHARARVEVLVEVTDDGVRVVVTDDGGGLPETLVGAPPTFPEEHRGGLGLGLVLAHLYLCAVGGSLRLGADAVTVEVPRA